MRIRLINRFKELQDEFCETETRLRSAETPEQKRELLSELQRIAQDSKLVLTAIQRDSDSSLHESN